jgi:hypothetical protein
VDGAATAPSETVAVISAAISSLVFMSFLGGCDRLIFAV